ncbi:hypothetical protein OSB04_000302 [Centaurea solstitialis]|uniref:RRM domain-containing protein n=1 Tax=Centaurea solstitialis TaxID=347529 RepID=A0AA38WUG7_9ASTR|nr:hypothetical protein OSB04_000302 [Centaurea solstitialis]
MRMRERESFPASLRVPVRQGGQQSGRFPARLGDRSFSRVGERRVGERRDPRLDERKREVSDSGHRFRSGYNELTPNRRFNGLRSSKEFFFLFYNFPEDWSALQLWQTFKKFGRLSDIYMANKRLTSGKKFGFVRFCNVINEYLLEKELNSIWLGTHKVRVHLANQKRKREVGSRNHQVQQAKGGFFRKSSPIFTYAEAVAKGLNREVKGQRYTQQDMEQKDQSDEEGGIVGRWSTDE